MNSVLAKYDTDDPSWEYMKNLIFFHLDNPLPFSKCRLYDVWGHYKKFHIKSMDNVDFVVIDESDYINPAINMSILYADDPNLLDIVSGLKIRVSSKAVLVLDVHHLMDICEAEFCLNNLDLMKIHSRSNKSVPECFGEIMVIDKPPNVLSVGKDSLESRYPGFHCAHRLDYGSSGILLMVDSLAFLSVLSYLFATQSVTKTYEVVLTPSNRQKTLPRNVWIKTNETSKSRVEYIKGDSDKSRDYLVDNGFVECRFEFVKNLPDKTTLAFAKIKTGRRHQVRLSASAIGRPLVGDRQYGLKNYQYRPMHLVCIEILMDTELIGGRKIIWEKLE